ncbi:MAG TPA: hypothetical protein VI546_06700, partial [candidate division Zixibacteria bacterium]|nr:hypothetical protein [candidate division Zixibacteria bacterium]
VIQDSPLVPSESAEGGRVEESKLGTGFRHYGFQPRGVHCAFFQRTIVNIMKSTLFVLLTISTIWPSSESVGKTKPAVFALKDFPLGVGSQWVYIRVDSSSSGVLPEGVTKGVVTDTVTVKIVGQTKSAEGRPVGIWVREFKDKVDTQQYITLFGAENPKSRKNLEKKDTCIQQALIIPNVFAVDTQYVTVVGDTVIFAKRIRISTDTTRPLYEQELFRFVFPLVAGNTWKGVFHDDSSTVSHKESIKVIENEFKAGFHVERRIWIPNEGSDTDYWIVPGIGIVRKENRYEFTIGNLYEVESWKLIRYEVKK